MKHERAFFCKSFRDDFARLQILVDSVARFGGDIPLLLSVPESDRSLLKTFLHLFDGVTVVSDEDYVKDVGLSAQGWYQQQVCKLSIHFSDFASTYLCIDSDMYLVDKVLPHVFYTNGNPNVVCSSIFTVFHKHNSDLLALLRGDKNKNSGYKSRGTLKNFGENLRNVKTTLTERPDIDVFGRAAFIPQLFEIEPGDAFMPIQILHEKVLSDFHEFLGTHELSLEQAISLSPWEFNWYGSFAMSAYADAYISPIMSPALCFVSDADMEDARSLGITLNVVKKIFPIVATAARHYDTTVF